MEEKAIDKYLALNKEDQKSIYDNMLEEYVSRIKVCFFCKSRKIKKNGKQYNIQRFICLKCGKTFAVSTLPPQNKLKKYISLYIKGYEIKKISDILNISPKQQFQWRTKFIDEINKIYVN